MLLGKFYKWLTYERDGDITRAKDRLAQKGNPDFVIPMMQFIYEIQACKKPSQQSISSCRDSSS